MFGASIAIAEDADDETVPVGTQALLISEDSHSLTPGGASANDSIVTSYQHNRSHAPSIAALFIQLPPLDQANQTVTKEGFLNKIGGNVKNWKTRYFRLCPGRLMYYKDGENLSPDGRLGAILLPGAAIALFSSDVYPGHSFCFGLTPADSERQYVFDCDSVSHRREWIDALAAPTRQRIRVWPESVREGFLTKLGSVVKNWKKRYCILTMTTLKYYATYDTLHDCLGTINLAGGFVVGSDDDAKNISSSESPSAASASAASSQPSSSSSAFLANNPYNFSVRAHGSDRTYIFCTTTRADRDGWITMLQQVQKAINI